MWKPVGFPEAEGHSRRTGHGGTLLRKPIVECSWLTASAARFGSTTVFTLKPHFPRAAPSHCVSTVGELELGHSCLKGASSNGQFWLGDSPSGKPKVSQSCAVVWNSSYSILPSSFLLKISDLYHGLKATPGYSCFFPLYPSSFTGTAFSSPLAHLIPFGISF